MLPLKYGRGEVTSNLVDEFPDFCLTPGFTVFTGPVLMVGRPDLLTLIRANKANKTFYLNCVKIINTKSVSEKDFLQSAGTEATVEESL